ncbi:hypothetical protein NU08_3491 [Flavobacterium anhuiense]|uniref:Uncharacterized protein n=2 Tax=Flavobacterium anhuiense TaxID=459526 RepID=A0A444VV46_9FLAO|nr:hypothetical protein NU08_3491 [Flavobacterium anhuiense]
MDFITITNVSYFFIFLGGIAAIVLSIKQAQGAEDDKKEIIEKQEKKIHELDSTLKEKIKFIESYISGGDAYPQLDIIAVSKANNINQMSFQLANNFELPIYDTKVEVYNFDKLKPKIIKIAGKDDRISQSDFTNSLIFRDAVATMTPHSIKGGIFITDVREGNFYAKLFTRNKMLVQKITIYHSNEIFYVGMAIYQDGSPKKFDRIYSLESTPEIKKILDKRLNLMPDTLIII